MYHLSIVYKIVKEFIFFLIYKFMHVESLAAELVNLNYLLFQNM